MITCAPTMTISSIDSAIFGEFSNTSSCASNLRPTAACPTVVQAQAELLCLHRDSCALSCSCDGLRSPPCLCEVASLNLTSAVPAWPCNGVRKSLGLTASCSAGTPATRPPQLEEEDSAPSGLLLQFMPSPVRGLDQLKPHFSWTPPAPLSQVAFRVNVSSAASGEATAAAAAAAIITTDRLSHPHAAFSLTPHSSIMPQGRLSGALARS